MTREEEILKAARNYVSGITLSSPSNVIHFEAGAKWADEHPNLASLWHDAGEEPLLEEKEIIFIDKKNQSSITIKFGNTFPYMLEDFDWEMYVKLSQIIKWAYVSDLLPK